MPAFPPARRVKGKTRFPWPLEDATAREVARLIGQDIDLARMEFFLEPWAAQVQQDDAGR